MDKAARIRWTVLLTVLCATVVAIFYPLDDAAPVPPAAVRIHTPKPPSVAAPKVAMTVRGVWEPLLDDPFAARNWNAPPAPAPAPMVVTAAPAVAEVVVAPPGPPPLPFQFVGQMTDSAQQVVYLSRGEQALLAKTGEVLEGTYKVLAITPLQIEFEHLPTGQKQALVFPPRND